MDSKSVSLRWGWLTTAFVLTAFALGGASRADTLSLPPLRFISSALLVATLLLVPASQWSLARRPLLALAAVAAIVAIQLVPLPPFLWQALPGRAIITDIDQLVANNALWRPLALDAFAGWNSLFSLVVPAAAFVLLALVSSEQSASLLKLMLLLVAIGALMGILQLFGGSNSSAYLYRVTNSDASVGLMANRNHHAFFIACGLPMIAALFSLARGNADRIRLLRFLALGGALSLLALLVLAGSRGGLALGVVGMAFSWLIYRTPQTIQRRRGAKKFEMPDNVLWLGLGLLAIVASLTTTRTTAIDRLLNGDPTSEARFQLLPVFADMIRDHFPFGGGAGSFVRLFQLYEPPWFLGPNYLNHAHNDYVELLIEHGILGAIAIAVALLLTLRAAFALWRRRKAGFTDQRQILGECGLAVIIMLLLGSAADYPLRVPSLQVFFALAVMWVALATYGPESMGVSQQPSGSADGPLLWAPSTKGKDT